MCRESNLLTSSFFVDLTDSKISSLARSTPVLPRQVSSRHPVATAIQEPVYICLHYTVIRVWPSKKVDEGMYVCV